MARGPPVTLRLRRRTWATRRMEVAEEAGGGHSVGLRAEAPRASACSLQGTADTRVMAGAAVGSESDRGPRFAGSSAVGCRRRRAERGWAGSMEATGPSGIFAATAAVVALPIHQRYKTFSVFSIGCMVGAVYVVWGGSTCSVRCTYIYCWVQPSRSTRRLGLS